MVEYFYDLTQNTWGRLSAVQWGSKALNPEFPFGPLCAKGLHREEYTYTAAGRATSKTLKLTRVFPDINNEERTAQMAIAYDYTNGAPPYQLSSPTLTKVTYPSTHTQAAFQQPVLPLAGAIYQYTYDSQGRPTGETRQDPNASAVSIVDQVTYNTFGGLTQMRQTLVSKTETRAYDSFQRMTSMTTFDGTAIAYNYSPTANDGKLVSQVTGAETVNYTYDVLGRLSQAATAGAGGWGMSWMYDGWGNRLQQSAVKGSVPTMVSITDPATNRIQAHTYDANGNTVNTPQQGAMTYDVINRLKTVAADTYGYDPSNKRIWKNDEYTCWGAGGERIGRYSAVKLVNDGGAHVFVFQKVQVDEYFGGRRLTSQDQLGSVGSYYPYGEAKSGTVSNADSFATYYRDSTALDYAQQRYYVVGSGRFLTPDPLGSSLNLYSYADTDPVNGNDPEGLLTVIVSGTSEQNATWSQPGSPMFNAIRDQFGETDGCVVVFDWSTSVAGTASGDAMRATGSALHNFINDAMDRCPGQPLNLVGYSHGGNVILNYLYQLPNAHFATNVVTLGTPARIDFWIDATVRSKFRNFCAVSLDNDGVQFGGAHPAQLAEYALATSWSFAFRSVAFAMLRLNNLKGYFGYYQLHILAQTSAAATMADTRAQPGARNFVYNGGLFPSRDAHTTVRMWMSGDVRRARRIGIAGEPTHDAGFIRSW